MEDRPRFENFDLHIGEDRAGLNPLTVQNSPAGESAEPTWLPPLAGDGPLGHWLVALEDGTLAGEELVALGRWLAAYLLPPGPVRDLWQRSWGMAETARYGLRLRLRMAPPQLAAVPWEYLYDEDTGDFLALNPRTVLVRYHSLPVAPATVAGFTPVPLLLLISSPPELPPLDAAGETRRLVEALGPLLQNGQARLDVLFGGDSGERADVAAVLGGQPAYGRGVRLLPGQASLDALRDALRHGYRILHYVGHGDFDETAGGVLALVDGSGALSLAGTAALARELRGSGVAVAVLNACRSAASGSARAFAGLAPVLVGAGLPAVVAMQYNISDAGAGSFAGALYRALADGWPLDAAVTEGRKAISARGGAEWGIPALFMRSPDGVLWQTAQAAGDAEATAAPPSARTNTLTVHGHAHIEGDVVQGSKTTVNLLNTGPYLSGARDPDWLGVLAALRTLRQGLERAAAEGLLDEEEAILARAQVDAALSQARKAVPERDRVCQRLREALAIVQAGPGRGAAGLLVEMAQAMQLVC